MTDTLPILLRRVDSEEFATYDSMTPTALDYLADYKDGVHQMEFQLDMNAGQQLVLMHQEPPTPSQDLLPYHA